MSEIEKTCENCEFEFESEYGIHCIKCIHNASDISEQFQPKAKYVERSKSIDSFAQRLADECPEKAFKIEIDGEELEVIAVDDIKGLIIDVAEIVKRKVQKRAGFAALDASQEDPNKEIKAKAIDEFVEAIANEMKEYEGKDKKYTFISLSIIKRIAEQLKGGE